MPMTSLIGLMVKFLDGLLNLCNLYMSGFKIAHIYMNGLTEKYPTETEQLCLKEKDQFNLYIYG